MGPTQYIFFIVTTSISKGFSEVFYSYDSPEELQSYLKDVHRLNPNITSLIDLGITSENRTIYCLKIGNESESQGTIIAEFGAHAREWVSHTSATYTINELIYNGVYNELITKITWFIIPLLNPDGYWYSKTHDRIWRKNRRVFNHSPSECYGVDVNRNFPVKWIKEDNVCDESYGGPEPLSESESKAIDTLFTLTPKEKVDIYVSVHSDAQCIILPYAYTRNRPKGYSELFRVARKMKEAMEKVGYPTYSIVQASDLYGARGTVFDWAYDIKKVPLVFTLELPFSDNFHSYFTANEQENEVIDRQCLAAFVACAMELIPELLSNHERLEVDNSHKNSMNLGSSKPEVERSASTNVNLISISLILTEGAAIFM